MSTPMLVRESEVGVVRLFALDLPRQEAFRMAEAPDQVAGLLGVEALDPGQVEIFDLGDLAGLGLQGYLAEGHGISEADLALHTWLLDKQSGAMVILRSAAITARPVTLMPQPPLHWVATFGEQRAQMPISSDIATDSARGSGTAVPPQEAAKGSIWVLVVALMLTGAVAIALWLALGAT